MRIIVLFLVSILIAIPALAFADYSAGQQAYDSGNYKEAFRAWQQSAKQGDAKSQYQLGKMYEEGLGVLQDFVLAHVFYNLAASEGNKKAREARNDITKMMVAEQLAEAQQLASQWQNSSSFKSTESPSSPQQIPPAATAQVPPTSLANTPEALFMAADEGNVEQVKKFLHSGMGVDTRNEKGWTPLMGASFKGHIDIVRILLDKGAGVNAQGNDGTTALIAATLPGHLEIVKALVDGGADVQKKNNAGVTARFIAEKKGHAKIVKLFPNPPPKGMVEIPRGEFTAGLEPEKIFIECKKYNGYCKLGGEPDESPVHTVYLETYYIDKYEITQKEYEKVTGNYIWKGNSSGFFHLVKNNSMKWKGPNFPVLVNWYEAKLYCEKLGKRLPTEAEWEKAAKGGQNWIYPWGNQVKSKVGNFCDRNCDFDQLGRFEDGHKFLATVGSYPPNPNGLYDLGGNVIEWVEDWYDENAYQARPNKNPKGPSNGKYKVTRGGSWSDFPAQLRTSDRRRGDPNRRGPGSGFRCAKSYN